MAHGYGTGSKGGPSKFRGGGDKQVKSTPKPSKGQDSRKTHDTSKKGYGGKTGR
ncbi:hypothetical protein KJ611_00010 [Patescibacteria group bacterium]|nr:hypothetical protein [Patescibacteria group bacterium]MBU1705408.1 hypothetical protein [Patescibacteria group bacterium]